MTTTITSSAGHGHAETQRCMTSAVIPVLGRAVWRDVGSRGAAVERMAELSELLNAELITKAEFTAKRQAILDSI